MNTQMICEQHMQTRKYEAWAGAIGEIEPQEGHKGQEPVCSAVPPTECREAAGLDISFHGKKR
jgi:hypothetical protein